MVKDKKEGKMRQEFGLPYSLVKVLEETAKKEGTSKASLVSDILNRHFNQDILTQEAIYGELVKANKKINQVKKVQEITFEVLTLFLESFYARAPDVPNESREAARQKGKHVVEHIINQAVKNVGLNKGLLNENNDEQEVMNLAAEILDTKEY